MLTSKKPGYLKNASPRLMPSDASIMEIRSDFKELLELSAVRISLPINEQPVEKRTPPTSKP